MLRFAVASLAALALTLFGAGPARAVTAWDQAKVTEIAQEVVSSVSGLRDALRNSPEWTSAASNRTVLYRIRDDLRWLENEAASLQAMLAQGDGMDATLNSYKRIQFLRRDAEQLAQQAQVSAITKPKLDAARAALEKLAAYYPPDASNP